jgi:hypothetical protein
VINNLAVLQFARRALFRAFNSPGWFFDVPLLDAAGGYVLQRPGGESHRHEALIAAIGLRPLWVGGMNW